MALNLKTFTTRAITAIIFVVILLAGICFNYLSFSILFFLVSIWGLIEFYQLAEKLGAKPYKVLGIIVGILLFLFSIISNSNYFLFIPTEAFFSVILVCAFLLFINALFDSKPNTALNLGYTVLGVVYSVLPFMLLLSITCMDKAFTFNNKTENWINDFAPYNFHYVLGIILLIWASDVAAYLVGSFIGKNKLFERISPGKTWEGSVGALIINIGCAFLVANWFPELALKHWIVISVLVSIFGTIGDLVESMFKRQAGVKDSGKIMPGHGGILDRFDSLLFVSPFIYAYLTIVKLF